VVSDSSKGIILHKSVMFSRGRYPYGAFSRNPDDKKPYNNFQEELLPRWVRAEGSKNPTKFLKIVCSDTAVFMLLDELQLVIFGVFIDRNDRPGIAIENFAEKPGIITYNSESTFLTSWINVIDLAVHKQVLMFLGYKNQKRRH